MFSLVWRSAKRLTCECMDLPLRAAVALGASGLGQPARPAQLFKAYGIVLPVGFLAWWIMPQVTLVMTPSIDAWIVHRTGGTIRRGDLVSFVLSDPLAGPKPVNVTKYALCMPGEPIAVVEIAPGTVKAKRANRGTNAWYYCDGRLMGISKPVARSGRRLRHWLPDDPRIPEGMVFVGSNHPDGYDSRYYGPVAIERLTRMEKLL
ncbi:S26 family signal peptidase [Novosphingobium resinovorum]|uniref:S26 family signal peptidase n=1 Tax=Novosphingobium TaxID=165696 RepID=UPI001B3C5FDA|nr:MULTISPECIES: S26 family signal peptidase [Novosphingobium]MBF7013691.1 S26 family signal peptidase [Novosphingobium sp. HR1a]WJM25835.1 S26 family signal peptidase [Novosphingobium resinovorum]